MLGIAVGESLDVDSPMVYLPGVMRSYMIQAVFPNFFSQVSLSSKSGNCGRGQCTELTGPCFDAEKAMGTQT